MIICILGPTACRKSEIAIHLVEKNFPCEIISVDAFMVYRHMNLGTAKPLCLNRIVHHMVDIRDPEDSFSVAEFCSEVKNLIMQIIAKRRIPLLVGGSMLYFYALLNGLSILPKSSPSIRRKLNLEASKFGWPKLYTFLSQIDPQVCAKIHLCDTKRILRALEVYYLTGKPLSDHFKKKMQFIPNNEHLLNIIVAPIKRKALDLKITKRFDDMIKRGFINEVQKLQQRERLTRDVQSLKAVGYQQIWDYLEKKIDLTEARKLTISKTLQLVKHQLTWLKKISNQLVSPFYYDPQDPDIMKDITKHIYKIIH